MDELIIKAFLEYFKSFFIIFGLIGLIILILHIVGLARLFKKAGKSGWIAIIPFYNFYVLVKIAGLNWWYFLLLSAGVLVSFINFSIFTVLLWLVSFITLFFIFYNLGKKFKQSPIDFGFLGMFFSIIMVLVLGFSKSLVYDESIKVNANGPIKSE